ncbi:unnamed protein product [Darwinula stevensoni]|uniref:Aldehyde dehydrogenase domain-containing protein n=1 Tax=Darwinula stevensoni TaxID=69355 RepID=A0A7R9AI98_9CRUS|nr:unnamed protein product [Darwinula stevensoni]CAG0906199.1 unnamed protein product [Darwinula stevensoni]
MMSRKIACALAAGCTCVVKPAEDTPLTALAFASLVVEAGVPPGVINILPCSRIRVQGVGNALAKHPLVRVLSFTGSTSVGKWLYERCSSGVKRLSLELGGNAPFIVFDSADMNAAVCGLMIAKFRNTGQTCVSANRILVQEGIYDAFVERFADAMDRELVVGHGLEPGVNQGPIINPRQFARVSA